MPRKEKRARVDSGEEHAKQTTSTSTNNNKKKKRKVAHDAVDVSLLAGEEEKAAIVFATKNTEELIPKIRMLKSFSEKSCLVGFGRNGLSCYMESPCQSILVIANLDLSQFGLYKIMPVVADHVVLNRLDMGNFLKALNHGKTHKQDIVVTVQDSSIVVRGESRAKTHVHKWQRIVHLEEPYECDHAMFPAFRPQLLISVPIADLVLLLQGQVSKTASGVFYVFLELQPDLLRVSIDGQDTDEIQLSANDSKESKESKENQEKRDMGKIHAKFRLRELLSIVMGFYLDKKGNISLGMQSDGLLQLKYTSQGFWATAHISPLVDD